VSKQPKLKTFYIYVKKYCPRRSLEASKNYNYLVKNGLRPVDNPKKADLIIIHTCGGFKTDEEFSLLTIKKALKIKSDKVIVTGCLPKINLQKLKPYENMHIITTEDLSNLDSLINAKVSYDKIPDSSVVYGVNDLHHGNLLSRIERHLGFNLKLLRIVLNYFRQKSTKKIVDSFFGEEIFKLEIAKGCVGNCTYCAIKLAMPKFHSTPEAQIVESFKLGLKKNYRHFALIAGDIGSYGIDIKTNLPSLLTKLFAVKGDYKIMLVDINARWFVKYHHDLFPILKNNADRISKIIMPIQSGSDRILKLMGRTYKINEVKKYLVDLQKNTPSIKVETHLLIGFPGETEEDFHMSVNFLKEVKFSRVEVYLYEDRPGTAASSFSNKVPKELMKKRAKILAKEDNVVVIN